MYQVGEYILHPGQCRSVDRLREARSAGHKRILLREPTGGGKTVVSCFVMQSALNKDKRCLFLADARQLVYQKSNKLTECGIPHSILMAGSDYHLSPVTVASRDTFWSRVKGGRVHRPEADLIVVDEAHKSTGDVSQAILKEYPEATIIGLTATPALGTGKGLGGFYDVIVEGSTYKELIADGLLCDVRCFSPSRPDLTGIAISDGDYNSRQLQRRMDTDVLVGDVVREWRRLGEDRPTVVFASGVSHSLHLCEEFNGAGIVAEHIDADTPPEERAAIFKRHRDGDTRVLCNMGVLTAGWDQPCVSCAILVRPTKSLVLFVQMVGRVLRSFPGKPDSVLIDHAGAVYRHGWPTDDREWALDPNQTVEEREANDPERKAREPFCCPKCAAMWTVGNSCPNCGYTHKKRGQKVTMADGTLREVKRKDAKKAVNDEHKVWMQCLAVAAYRDMNVAGARVLFKSKVGRWPDDMHPMPDGHQWTLKVRHLYPGFIRTRKETSNAEN